MRFLLPTALAFLALAVPAWAAEEPVCFGTNDAGMPTACPSGSGAGTVGDGDVVTDPANEIDQPGMRGEIHVLGESRGSATVSSHAASSHGSSSSDAADDLPPGIGPRKDALGESTPEISKSPVAHRHNGARELPFTGIDAWMLALGGLILVEAGIRLRRVALR